MVVNAPLIADWVTIIGGISLLLTLSGIISQRTRRSIEEYRRTSHQIVSLRAHLLIVGSWANADNGGYKPDQMKSLLKSQEATWGNPFSQVFNLSKGSLDTFVLSRELFDLDPDLVEAITRLNQEIVSFNSALDDIRAFKFSGRAIENVRLHLQLNGAGDVKEGIPEEALFKNKLVELYTVLHVNMIGDAIREDNRRLHYWHKICSEALENAEQNFMFRNRKWYRWLIRFWRLQYAPLPGKPKS